MFGASDATIGYAMDYLSIYLLGTLFVELALGLNAFIICQSQPRIAMFSVLIGAVANQTHTASADFQGRLFSQ